MSSVSDVCAMDLGLIRLLALVIAEGMESKDSAISSWALLRQSAPEGLKDGIRASKGLLSLLAVCEAKIFAATLDLVGVSDARCIDFTLPLFRSLAATTDDVRVAKARGAAMTLLCERTDARTAETGVVADV